MKSKALITLVFCLTFPTFGNAETSELKQLRCWLGSMTFSPGTTIRAGGTIMECTNDYRWIVSDKEASGCLYAGKLYSPGAVVNDAKKSDLLTICKPDGNWSIAN